MNTVCGIDPGFSGAISIIKENGDLTIHVMPVIKTVKTVKGKKKTKTVYNLEQIRKILKENLTEKSVIVLEQVSSMPGEGSVSSFNFGRGYGNIEGLVCGLFDKNPILVAPQTWKKHFPELTTQAILDLKEEAKELRVKAKTIKDKALKKANKKEIDKISRQVKIEAKKASRELASSLCPKLAHRFKRVKDDGLAESLLIAIFGKDTQSNLE